jgi:hypothetical protein
MNAFTQHLTRFVIVSLIFFTLPVPPAQAGLVPTYAVAAPGEGESARRILERYLQREDVRAGLERHGVNPAAARARVDALADEEVAAVAGRIDTQAAGGEFIAAIVFVFVLLLVTDILGYTKVFKFTRSANK